MNRMETHKINYLGHTRSFKQIMRYLGHHEFIKTNLLIMTGRHRQANTDIHRQRQTYTGRHRHTQTETEKSIKNNKKSVLTQCTNNHWRRLVENIGKTQIWWGKRVVKTDKCIGGVSRFLGRACDRAAPSLGLCQ